MTSLAPRLASTLASLSLVVAAGACAEEPADRMPPTPPPPAASPAWVVGDAPTPDRAPIAEARCIPAGVTAAHHGTAGIDELRDVVVTRRGRILVAGFDGGQPSFQVTPRDSRGVVLELGDQLAPVATLRTAGTDAFEALALDRATGRLFAAARTTGDLPGFRSEGSVDYVIGALAPGGFTAMARGAASTWEMPRGLAAHADRLALVGFENRVVADGSTWINPFLDTYVVDERLSRQWSTTRVDATPEVYTAVAVADARIVAGGKIGAAAEAGLFVGAWSHDADVLWRRQLSASAQDALAGVHVLPDGTVIWAGTQRVIDADAGINHDDIVVGALDGATGEPLWTTHLGATDDASAVDLAVDAAGNIHVAGNVTAADGDRDVMLLTFDAAGAVVRTESWSSPGVDTATAIAVDACGTAVIVGATAGDLGGPAQGLRDGFVLIAR